MKRYGWLIGVIVFFSLGGVLAARRGAPAKVPTVRPQRQDVTRTLAVTGQVEAISNASISSTLNGMQVQAVLVDKGTRVTKGQPLVQLDDRELRAAAAQAEAQVRQAEASLLRAKAQANGAGQSVTLAQQAADDSIDLKTQRDQASANVKGAQARLAQARENAIRTREGARQQAVRQAQAQLRQAQSQLRLSTLNFQRQESLFQQGASSRAEYDVAKTNLENAKETVTSAQEQVAQLAEPRTEDVRQAEASVRESQAALDGAKQALQNAERAYRNRFTLRQGLTNAQTEKLTSQAAIAVAEADLLRARAQWAQARTQLSKTVLRSPVTGIVTDRKVEPGETVAAGVTLLTIVAPRNLRLKTDIDEANLHDIRVGQEAVVTLDAFPTLKLAGKVAEIVPSADNARGTVEVRVTLDTPSDKLLPQLTTNINIVTGIYKDALTLPREAIKNPDGNASVLLVKEGKVVEQPLSITGGDSGRVVVTKGIDTGAEVILAPDKVKVGDTVESLPSKTEGKP